MRPVLDCFYLCTWQTEGNIRSWIPANHGWTSNATWAPPWTVYYITVSFSKILSWFLWPDSLRTACGPSLAVLKRGPSILLYSSMTGQTRNDSGDTGFWMDTLKGIVHFEIKMWYLSAYPKGIQDVGVFFSSVDPILMFLGQTVLVCQSYNGRYRSLSLWEGKRTCTEKFKLNNSPS